MIYDTLKLSKTLRDKGFSSEQAEGIAEALNEATQSDLATKSDILSLKTDIAELKAELLKWLIGAIGFQTVVIIGAMIAIMRGGLH